MARSVDVAAARFAFCGGVLLTIAVGVLAYALVGPIGSTPGVSSSASRSPLPPIPQKTRSIESLLIQCGTKELIRATRVQAAVKDTGVAKELAKRLKLEGVIELDGQYVAYIKRDKSPSISLREQDTILDFTVRAVKPGRVVLSIDGIDVVLSQ